MARGSKGRGRSWTWVSLLVLLLLGLFAGVVVVRDSTRPVIRLGSKSEQAGANTPVEGNRSDGHKQEEPADANERPLQRPDHNHPAFGERVGERERMVTYDIKNRGVNDPNVLRAMRTVPRHAFVQRWDMERAYADHPLPIGLNQTISQPYIVGYMTEYLELDPNSKVFEVGTGSGYQAAVCGEIAGEVYTVEIVEKRRGKRQAELSLLQNKIGQIDELESNLLNRVQTVLRHHTRPEFGGLKDAFGPEQREAISQVNTILRQLSNLDRDIKLSYNTLENMDEELRNLEEKADGVDLSMDRGVVTSEFQSVRQMSKMCVGRQGNHFPILMKQYFRPNIREMCTRENVINIMAKVESIDSGVFERTFKGQTSRIVPYIVLLPTYGDTGICWEPFERYNRASSRGRIALPLFPKDVETAVISALADLRWQVAKERAQHYWMEEGITGRYYQWFQEQRLRGDVKDYFTRDYILWIVKESQGTQKLEREVRGIFWRMLPFPQGIKDNLKNRGFVYGELYKKDLNISMSDGY